MEKIKITQAQAEAVEKAWKMSGNKVFIIRMHDRDGSVLIEGREQLGDISTDTLIKALYIGYEVEPEFKVGDWVTWQAFDGKLVGKVLDIDEFDRVIKTDMRNRKGTKLQFSFGDSELSHATPSEIAEEKERRFWKKNGRNVWELKNGDVLWDEHRGEPRNVYEIRGGIVDLMTCRLSFEEIKGNYSVICFAESRLDVKRNNN